MRMFTTVGFILIREKGLNVGWIRGGSGILQTPPLAPPLEGRGAAGTDGEHRTSRRALSAPVGEGQGGQRIRKSGRFISKSFRHWLRNTPYLCSRIVIQQEKY